MLASPGNGDRQGEDVEVKGKKVCSSSEWEETEVKHEGSQSAFPMQRDPLLWKAGVGIATVREVRCIRYTLSVPSARTTS